MRRIKIRRLSKQSRSQSPRAFGSAPRHGLRVLVLTKRHVGSGNEIGLVSGGAISFQESSFPMTSGRKTRTLGATISGMHHRCKLRSETGWAEFGYLMYGCSQSSRFSDRCSRGTKTLGTRLMEELIIIAISVFGKCSIKKSFSTVPFCPRIVLILTRLH